MNNPYQSKASQPNDGLNQSIKAILSFLFFIWLSYFLSFFLPINQFGIIPRTLEGLPGIILAPFLHGSLDHIIGNSISFSIFAIILALLERRKIFTKLLLMVVIGGSLTWLMARDANHIGASGLIFSIFGYLLLAGWFSKKIKYILVSIFLIFFYSGMIIGIFPSSPNISWEGHLFGFIAGILVARIYH